MADLKSLLGDKYKEGMTIEVDSNIQRVHANIVDQELVIFMI